MLKRQVIFVIGALAISSCSQVSHAQTFGNQIYAARAMQERAVMQACSDVADVDLMVLGFRSDGIPEEDAKYDTAMYLKAKNVPPDTIRSFDPAIHAIYSKPPIRSHDVQMQVRAYQFQSCLQRGLGE